MQAKFPKVFISEQARAVQFAGEGPLIEFDLPHRRRAGTAGDDPKPAARLLDK
jgi:hypothetical protein